MKRIDENHSFNINVACIVGERKAILLKEQYGWCLKNLHNQRNIHGGHAWTYNSAKAYAEKFPYWNQKSISRWLKEMEDDGWIASANLNKIAFDRTKWYTVNFRRYDLAVTGCEMTSGDIEKWKKEIKNSISHNEESDSSKMENDNPHNEEPIPPLTTSSPSLEPERENAPANLDFFNPNKHEETAAHLIEHFSREENAMWLNGIANGNWRRAVKGYCMKLQKMKKWHELTVPTDEGRHYIWVGEMLAGIKSWYQAAAEIDRKSGRQDQQQAVIKAPPTTPAAQPIRRATPEAARKIAGI